MNTSTILAFVSFYFMTWMICFFIVLPFGAHNQIDDGEHVPGSEPGAPVVLRMRKRLVATTLLALVVVLLLMWGVSNPTLQRYWAVDQVAVTQQG
ncbi:MAG TPA: DUF1467 family protein [Devosia sp.]|nr:DUF1467 family protein [Devosia sp.]